MCSTVHLRLWSIRSPAAPQCTADVWQITSKERRNKCTCATIGHTPVTAKTTSNLNFHLSKAKNKGFSLESFSALNHFLFWKYTEPQTGPKRHTFSITCVHSTFDRGVGRRALNSQVPRWVPLVGEVPHLQVADGEPDDGGLVQLAGDGAWQRQHLGQLIKLKVLFSPPRPCRIPWLLLPQSLQPVRRERKALRNLISQSDVKNVIISNQVLLFFYFEERDRLCFTALPRHEWCCTGTALCTCSSAVTSQLWKHFNCYSVCSGLPFSLSQRNKDQSEINCIH